MTLTRTDVVSYKKKKNSTLYRGIYLLSRNMEKEGEQEGNFFKHKLSSIPVQTQLRSSQLALENPPTTLLM